MSLLKLIILCFFNLNYFSVRSRVKGYLELYLAYVPEQEPGTSGRLSADGEWEMIENADTINISHTPAVRSLTMFIFDGSKKSQ